MRRGTAAVGLAIAVSLAVTACASSTGRTSNPGRCSRAAPPGEVHCPTSTQLRQPGREPIPDGFSTMWVLRCGDTLRAVTGNGTWFFRIEERADTGTVALVSALRRPDEQTPPGTACSSVGVGVPYFALVDASGTIVYPRVPLGQCNQPQRQALDALKALPFREIKATRLYQEQSQGSIDTGCGQMWTDAPAGDMLAHSAPASNRRMWPKTPDALRICQWRTRTTGLPELLSAGTITGPDLVALLARLDHLAAARPCTARHHRFAVLEYVRHGWWDGAAYSELDGCRIILRPDHTLGQIDSVTANLLVRLSQR